MNQENIEGKIAEATARARERESKKWQEQGVDIGDFGHGPGVLAQVKITTAKRLEQGIYLKLRLIRE